VELHTFAERPDLAARLREIGSAFPEFMYHDAVVNRYWAALPDELQLVLYDEEQDRVVGEARTVPFAGELPPAGLDELLERAFSHDARPTTLSALLATLSPDVKGRGLSRRLLDGMRDVARRHGLHALVAPVRPTLKARYPLVAMERYAAWTRDDGLPFDPWLRAHARLGAEIVAVAPRSMTIEGTVREWEDWAGLALPESGDYVVEGALVPVSIDRERDRGVYVEPNVWMRHAV
jgi:GNAT superfamily N-acetyltransferase